MSNKICPLPWNHISIQHNGDYRMCCQCVYPPFGKPGMRVQDVDIDSVRNSELHKRVRRQMLAGEEPAECKLCWDEEALGLKSKRVHMLTHYSIDKIQTAPIDGSINIEEFPLQYVDIRFGNLCNLKCRTCGPPDSSLWYEDFVALNTPNKTEFDYYGTNKYQLENINNVWTLKHDDFTWYDDENFWTSFAKLIPYIDRLYLTGGEPWFNKAQWRLLELCVSIGYSKNILLEYNSNMTKIPDYAKGLWDQFKLIQVGCSIDAVGDLANYIRFPSKWEEVEANVRKIAEMNTMTAKFAPTISVFNVLGFLDLIDWLQFNRVYRLRPIPSFHILQGPDYQNLTVLPLETKKMIVERYEYWFSLADFREKLRLQLTPILDFMMSADNSHLLPKLKSNTQKLDSIRNQNIRDFLPWLADVLDKVEITADLQAVDMYW